MQERNDIMTLCRHSNIHTVENVYNSVQLEVETLTDFIMRTTSS